MGLTSLERKIRRKAKEKAEEVARKVKKKTEEAARKAKKEADKVAAALVKAIESVAGGGVKPPSGAEKFNRVHAIGLCRISQVAYTEGATDLKAELSQNGVTHEKTFNALISKVFIGTVDDGRQVVVGFRGSTTIPDWGANLAAVPVPWSRLGVKHFRVLIHAGFLAGYAARMKKVIDMVGSLIDNGGLRVYVTGHSLGGAMAMLAALDIRREIKCPVRMYTYGAPRVGNNWFANYFNSTVSQSFRIVDPRDVVPKVPLIPYYHAGHHVALVGGKGKRATSKVGIDPDPMSMLKTGVKLVTSIHSLDNYLKRLGGEPNPSKDWWKGK